MAITKCSKCGSTFFELKETKITKCNYKRFFIQCSSCGTAVDTVPYHDTNNLIADVDTKVEELTKKVERLARALKISV